MAENTKGGMDYQGVIDEISQLTARPGGFISDDKGGSGGGLVPRRGNLSNAPVYTGVENVPQPITLKETPGEPLPVGQMPSAGGVTGQNPASPSTPISPGVTQPPTAGQATPTQGWWNKEGWGVSGMGGKTPLGEQPTAVRVTKGTEEEPATLLEARGIGELQKSPEQIAQERLVISGGVSPNVNASRSVNTSGIDSLISEIKKNLGNFYSDGSMRPYTMQRLAELEHAKLTAQTASEGHGVTAQGHKISAEASMDYRKAQLESTKERNQLLHQDLQLRLSQQRDVAAQKALETSLNRFAVHEADPMNPTDKAVNMRATYFNVFDSGTKPHPSIADAVGQVGDEYKAYRENTMKLSKVKTLTPEEEKQVKARFRKSITLYPDITTKK
jgi:hypothetical protein